MLRSTDLTLEIHLDNLASTDVVCLFALLVILSILHDNYLHTQRTFISGSVNRLGMFVEVIRAKSHSAPGLCLRHSTNYRSKKKVHIGQILFILENCMCLSPSAHQRPMDRGKMIPARMLSSKPQHASFAIHHRPLEFLTMFCLR